MSSSSSDLLQITDWSSSQSLEGEVFDPTSRIEADQGIALSASNIVTFDVVSNSIE